MNKTSLSLPLLLLSGLAQAQTEMPNREFPNVLFILADDLGYGDIGCYGQEKIQTPNIDRLAQRGMQMSDFYAGASVSAPSRASLMTGLHTGHTKIRGNKEIKPQGQEPMSDRLTIAELFKRNNYKTGLFGKWGLGFPKSGSEPLDRGFDRFVGYNCQRIAHYYYPEFLWSDRREVQLEGNKDNGRKTYAPDYIQREAKAFIKQSVQEKTPFFAMMTYTLPHAELNLPHDATYQYYRGRLKHKPWRSNYKYAYPPTPDAHSSFAAMVGRLDAYVGELMSYLEELGVQDNTLIIFTSDNGPHWEGGANPDYFNSNGNLRGYKRDLYEGGIRVPMIVAWNGHIHRLSESNYPSAFWDFLPTFEELLGEKKSESDGQSLLNIWYSKENTPQRERPLFWEFHPLGGKMALRLGNWKLVALNVNSGKITYELYRLDKDLAEQHNLADQEPEQLQKMIKLMQQEHRPSSIFPFPFDKEKNTK